MDEYIKKEDVENIMLSSWGESALWKLRYLPSEDVEPVRHGRWVADLTSPYGKSYICSECGVGQRFRSAYCHNCGARMVGDEK